METAVVLATTRLVAISITSIPIVTFACAFEPTFAFLSWHHCMGAHDVHESEVSSRKIDTECKHCSSFLSQYLIIWTLAAETAMCICSSVLCACMDI